MKKIYTSQPVSGGSFLKMRHLIYTFFLCLGGLFFIQTPARAQYLHTEGKKILDGNNDEVILRGLGLGGWMLQEGYMLHTSGPQYKIEKRIEDLIGAEKKEAFYDAWLANHFRKVDVDSMAAWGFNSIRLPMHYKLFTPSIQEEPVAGEITWNEKGFKMVDSLLAWVKANNMYLILDLHATPGGQGENADINDYDSSKPSLWESQENQDKMVALWRKLAERYANEPNIGAYDIINEPNWGFQNHASDPNGCSESENTQLWSLEKRITKAIREVDQNHIIIIEGNCWGNNYSGLPGLWDDNIAMSYHKYWNGTDQSSIQGMLNMRDQRDVPIWLGESGENSNKWFTDVIDLLESNKVGWSWWPEKKMGINNPLEIKVNQGYQDILDYWDGKSSRPAENDAYEALMQLAEDLKLENNIYHKDVVDAMIRQPHSDEALPFNDNHVTANSVNRIFATDFDLGKNEIAYYDKEASNTTGNAGGLAWNKGYSYRNDGVDIQACDDDITNGYNVGWTEDGEWLQYTLNVDSTGVYQVDVRYATSNSSSKIKLMVADADQTASVTLPSTGGYQDWESFTIDGVVLYKGKQPLKVFIEKGGFNLNYIELTLKKKLSEVNFNAVSGETSESGETITLAVNKIIDESSVTNNGFSLTIDGQNTEIAEVAVSPENSRSLMLNFQSSSINEQSDVKLSYSGDGIMAGDGTVLTSFTDLTIKNNLPTRFNIPTQIEAEDYDFNNGLQLETTTDTGGGQNVGYTNTGDYLDYLIYVAEAGEYNLQARVACNSQAGILEFQQLTDDGEVINKVSVDVPVTGGWQTWKTVDAKMTLNEGRGMLRVKIVQPEFNINWFKFSKNGTVNGLNDNAQGSMKIFPNPAHNRLSIAVPDGAFSANNELSIWEIDGSMIYQNHHLAIADLVDFELGVLPSGLYLVVLNMDTNSWKQKLIVE